MITQMISKQGKIFVIFIATMFVLSVANAQVNPSDRQAERERLQATRQAEREKQQAEAQERQAEARQRQQEARQRQAEARQTERQSNPLVEFKRDIQREFTVSSTPTLSIKNQFGRIRIIEGTNNQIVFKITLTGKGKDANEAKRIAESIDVSFNQSGTTISAETKHGQVQCNNCGRIVDFEVTVPRNTKHILKNQHGDIELNNAVEPLEIDIQFGKLYANEISDANLTIQHGGATINKCGTMQIKTGFSQYQLGDIGVMSGSVAHSTLKIDQLGNTDITSEFSHIEIGRLKQSFITNKYSHGSLKINRIDENFSQIKIDANFSPIKIALTRNHSFKAVLQTDFGNINVGNVEFSETSLHKKDAIVGFAGNNKNPSATVEISNSHGGLVFE